MRILLVSTYDLSVAGGVTSHVMDLARQFRQLGHYVTVAGPARSGDPPNNYTHYIGGTFRFPTPGDNAFINLNPLITGKVREFVQDLEFDVVHVHEPFCGFIGPSFIQGVDAVRVGTFHATRNGPHLPYAMFQPYINRWNRLLDGRIAVSETAKETVARYFPGEYTTIPNGIDFSRFSNSRPSSRDAGSRSIVFVGRLEERKGIQFLLRAYGALKQRLPDANLIIVGDGEGRTKYERLASQLRLEDVSFEGFVPASELPEYYRRASVVCQPSTCNESFGITVLEAMASGRPVVSSTIPGFRDLVEPGVTGLAVPPKDAPALADALELVLTDTALGDRLAVAGQEHAAKFDWPEVAGRLINYYEECFERTLSRTTPRTATAYRVSA